MGTVPQAGHAGHSMAKTSKGGIQKGQRGLGQGNRASGLLAASSPCAPLCEKGVCLPSCSGPPWDSRDEPLLEFPHVGTKAPTWAFTVSLGGRLATAGPESRMRWQCTMTVFPTHSVLSSWLCPGVEQELCAVRLLRAFWNHSTAGTWGAGRAYSLGGTAGSGTDERWAQPPLSTPGIWLPTDAFVLRGMLRFPPRAARSGHPSRCTGWSPSGASTGHWATFGSFPYTSCDGHG